MKKQKQIQPFNPFDLLSEELVFIILDLIAQNPVDLKSFSLTCKWFYHVESKNRRTLKPLRSEFLPRVLTRYPNSSHLDLTFCPRVTDNALRAIADFCGPALRSLDLSRSGAFSAAGLLSVAVKCVNLVEIDLSNATEMRDAAAAVVAEARNLERLRLGRCKLLTDMGIGCIAVGCRKLSLVGLKWCVGVGDLGAGLLALKCKGLRSLDLSYLPITGKCLDDILKLQHLEELLLEGCFGIDDDSLSSLRHEHECKSLKKLDVSSCQNLTHRGLTSLLSAAGCLQQLVLAHGSSSITLDGCSITSDGLKAIGILCKALKELSLSKCLGVTDEDLSSLVMKQKGLRKLDITCCRKLTGVSIAQIANSCPSLISLKMESCSLVPRDAFVLIGQKCRFLKKLDLTDNEIDEEGLKSISGCLSLSSLKVGICLNITDKGLSYVGTACSDLRELDLYRSAGITDVGVSSIARGCSNLETINISYCKDITDKSLVSLSKCSRLNTLECRGCPLVTSMGVAAVAVGCKRLAKLDVKKCQNINDSAMLTLAHFSPCLKQISVSETGVTDVGLMSLGNIGCLQNVAVVQSSGLTPSGLTASLLALGALRKLKLHSSFKTLLPLQLIYHMEARGCAFLWKDQTPQEELDPKYWKLQLEDYAPLE
ncbi:PREDICTED: F-box/LRR-repeat protein 3-like isoform X2 [Tarenaya hassleriana]|uniref:F-box/LRR-repeat protein 3-like isoform X2 n=1 Tax=Tarenaya hassleriana TaxID=28532 RepID=UPI00053C3A40|nr:PREDICTED: F-box/LRR-repeat protein 3-like isoform X2 [Tarenaya hassleriana]